MVIVGGGIGGLVLALCLDQVYNHPVSAATEHQKDGSSSTTTTTSATSTTPTTTRRRPRLPIHVYESTSAYTNNAGGAIGLFQRITCFETFIEDTSCIIEHFGKCTQRWM